MKRFLRKLLLFAGVHVLLLAVAFILYARKYPPAESFYMASFDKHSLLRTQAPPRLIFVGGSSMALGMDSELVATRCGFHPINMGLNMAVGLEFMLQEIIPHVRSGDVVLVAPEYHTFEKFYKSDPEYVARLIECRPSVIRSLSWSQDKALLDEGYLRHLGRLTRVVLGGHDRVLDGLTNPYNKRSSFNANGDIVSHHGVVTERGAWLRFEFTSSPVADAAIAHLNRFHAECRRRGVRVFYLHAPYERKFYDRYAASIGKLEAMLRDRLTIPMLDTAQELTFPSDEIFDVEYHLNLAGKMRRSEFVARRLKAALQASQAGEAGRRQAATN